MTVYDHIRELQMRFFYSGIALTLAGIVVFIYYQPLLIFLSSPLEAPLYYNNPAGGFNFIVKVCFTGALILTMPVLIYNIIMFVRPAIEKHLPIKRVFIVASLSTILAIAGAAFAFYCILPGTLHFLKEFENSGLSALIAADDYLKFVTNIIITFVIVFQLPLIITFFDSIRPLQTEKLLRMEKWVILSSVAVALVAPITYDLLTSLMLAVPIILLYNLSVVIVVIRHALAKQKTTSQVETPMIIDEDLIARFADELDSFRKVEVATTTYTNTTGQMDIKPSRSAVKTTVEPAAWVHERQLHRAAFNSNVKVFSDIRPIRRVNPSLT